ncbi:hypothetical protein GALMADRAFT_132410 [Galerina marginata CBS 339.88]|uniref:Aminodeoxychorismate lyase n=1 Tax=Galerina marginata (strain CBS 339.88) TaxID=685588 RepID=A0A067TR97_GALM3|nr:hypothetical protein GALMADRAFT_132410 [Galerina marginata CBS 339.88]
MMMEGESAKTPFQLLTSTRYDPFLSSLSWNDDQDGPSPFFLLPLHFDRLVSASETHNWLYAKSVLRYTSLKSSCLDAISEQRIRGNTSSTFRLRITVSPEGRIAVTAASLPTSFTSDPSYLPLDEPIVENEDQHGPTLRIYVDEEPITPSVFTQTKTTFRDIYDLAKARNDARAPEATSWDVVLYNEEGQITETTIFNVAFRRSSQWITPSTTSGCLSGVMRKWLLDNGRICEDTDGILTKDSVQEGEWVLLFNGVQGCRLGKIYT